MDLADFSSFYKLDNETQDFIVKYGFNEIADRLENIPESLSDDYIINALSKLRKKEDSAQLLAAAAELRNNRFLLANYNFVCYYWLERSDVLMSGYKLPQFENAAEKSEYAGLFSLLAVLAAFECVEKTYRKLGLPDEIAQDTLQYTSGAIAEYASGNDGKLGINARKLHWYRFYIDGKLFRIGRLEYMIQDPLPYLPVVYRRKSDGKVIALCRNGWVVRKDGLIAFLEDQLSETVTVDLVQTEDTICGTPINPAGFVELDRRVTLKLDEYTPLWNMWDLVPGIHIPGGGGMKKALIEESLRKARDFFPKYFKRRVAGFSCFSWIFNPDFEAELPNSNLADFMREVYLFPFKSVGVEGLQFVFGKSAKEWSDFPADNSLRLAFHRIREAGKRLKAGGMFIDAASIDKFGSQPFRNDYAAFDEL